MTGPSSTWLQCVTPLQDPVQRLVCFPHAGGAATFYRAWGPCLPGIEVHAVRYPGRAERIDEPPASDLRRLAGDIADAVTALADRPLALFGHSLGAVVALETTRSLEAGGVRVNHLFASGSMNAPLPGPSSEKGEEDPDDAETIQRLLELGGTDPELAADPDFQELVLPYVRADGRMFHDYVHRTEPMVDCPVTTIVGEVDLDADRRPWESVTTRALCQETVPGDHFYLVQDPPYRILRSVLPSTA